MYKFSISLLLASSMFAVGCKSEPENVTNATSGAGISAISTVPSTETKGAPNAPVVNDPSLAPEGSGYIVKPANPSDPKYQAAPGLGGGGG